MVSTGMGEGTGDCSSFCETASFSRVLRMLLRSLEFSLHSACLQTAFPAQQASIFSHLLGLPMELAGEVFRSVL